METNNTRTPEQERAVNDIIALGQVAIDFARVERAPRMPDGRRETDVEHSYHLSLTAAELAARFYPDLDAGDVALFSIVHDLPEVHVGDVWTFNISDEDRAAKEAAEKEATAKLLNDLPPFWASVLERYEEQQEPAARFVRLVDKITPAVINMLDDPATSTFLTDHNVQSIDELYDHRARSAKRLQEMYPEFEVVHIIKAMISERSAEHFFAPDQL